MSSPSDILERVLGLLRTWGWEGGYKRLAAELDPDAPQMPDEVRRLFLGWMAGERGIYSEAREHLQIAAEIPYLRGWAMVGLSAVALRLKQNEIAEPALAEAAEANTAADPILGAAIDHYRGTMLFHRGEPAQALPYLDRALQAFGDEHFATGRVLDTLGMLYANKSNFHAAQEFYLKALECKAARDDKAGEALTHGQLGRLYLDWGLLQQAEDHFRRDLNLARVIGDEFGQAKMFNNLGQVYFSYGELASLAGLQSDAVRHFENAVGMLESAAARARANGWTIIEAFSLKDLALVHLAMDRVNAAEDAVDRSLELFAKARFAEGQAHAQRVLGILKRRRDEFEASGVSLRSALRHFEETGELAEAAYTKLELARLHRSAGEPRPLVVEAFRDALDAAEMCRRAGLIRQIEHELMQIDANAYHVHRYRRVRGRGVPEDSGSLVDGTRDAATVLFLDLEGSADFARRTDPEIVMMVFNQMMAEMVTALRRREALISGFRGDGFMALFRGPDHAVRAVTAALDMLQALREFNSPRDILRLPRFVARIGVSSGEVFLGNVGTYDKMDFTALGTAANLGARLEANAVGGYPCISQGTYELVRHRFVFAEGNPRKAELRGLGEQALWDVMGPRQN